MSFFDEGAHCEAHFTEICTILIRVLTSQPVILSLVSKTATAQKTESSLFPKKFKFFLGSLASDIAEGSNLFNGFFVLCHAKSFIQKRLYILPKDSKHSYLPLKFMYIVRSL